MDTRIPTQEEFIPFGEYRLWYRSIGGHNEKGKLPLLCLHGGPGIPSDYLEPLERMADTGRRVIRFDQLGCGNSDQPHNPSMWTIKLFVDQVVTVRRVLKLEQVHLLGQSWGGMLAMEYALTQPAGLVSLTLASSLASLPQWMEEASRLRAELPADVQKTLEKHEREGTTDSPAYQEAMLVYYRCHVCRIDPWPDYVERAFAKVEKNPEVYHTMWGPSEFYASGTLKDWNIIGRLGEIHVPTLVTSGRYDEATPEIAETIARGIPDSEWTIFENSGHFAHAEEAERYHDVLNRFLQRVERQRLTVK